MKFFTLNESNQIDGVTSPEELLSWMENNITYELVDDEYSNSNGVPTKTAQEVLKTKTGHCAEQSYLEKMILDSLGYKSFYGMVKENNSEKEYGAEGSAHLFLIYLDEDNKYCWFEHSRQHCKGIHKFNSLEELFKEVSKQWWRYDKNSDILECRIVDRDITGVDNWGLAKECYKYPVKYTFPISDNAMEDDIPLDAKWDFDHRSVLQESFDSRLNKIDTYIQNSFGQESPGNGCIFIAPNGKFINIYPKLVDHEDLAEWLNEKGFDSVPLDAEWFVDTLGYVRCRNSRNQCYIELPIVAITRHQLYALEEWLIDMVVSNQIEIEAPNGQWHTYDLKEYFSEDIIKIIKRFYSSGNLYEDLPSSDTIDGELLESLSTKISRRDNPNDFSPFGYKVDFYDGDKHIGEGSVCGIKDDNAFLYDFEVYPEFRGKGYSKEMLQYLIDQYDLKQLFVKPDNTIAINLYKKYGFKFEDDAYDTDDIGNMRLMIRESYKMRFKLTEGKNLEQTVQQYVDKYQKMIPLDDDELYIHRNHVMGLISIDPTYKPGGNVTGDYAIWILNQAIKNGWDVIGTKQRVLHLLTEFQDKKSLLKNKDIMSYKTPDDLAQALSEVELTDRQKERRARHATAMTKKVLSTENWDVYMALNWEGALTLGKGTKWCTADSENASWYIRYVADIWWDGDAGAVEVKDLEKETLTLQDITNSVQDDNLTLEQIYDKYSDRAVFAYWDGSGWLYNPYEVKNDGDVHDKLYVFINKNTGIKYQFCMSSSQSEYEEDLNDAITFCTQNDHYRDFRDFIGYEEKELREFWTDVMGYSMEELFVIDPDEEDDIEESFLTEAKADTQRLIDWAGEELANRYLAIKDRLKAPESDLYYWIKNKSVEDLRATVASIETTKSNNRLSIEGGYGATLVGENDYWKVYHITSYGAAQKYGRDTQWCISGNRIGDSNDSYWKNYINNGVEFYFYITKGKYNPRGRTCKFALAYQPGTNKWQVYDQQDGMVDGIPNAPIIDGLPDVTTGALTTYQYTGGRLPISTFVKDIIVADDVTKIDGGAFMHSDMESIHIGKGVTHIGNNAFTRCANLETVVLPDGVQSIGFGAFGDCYNLTDITIPDTVTSIGKNAFVGCTKLTIHTPMGSVASSYADAYNIPTDSIIKENYMKFSLVEGIADVRKHYQDISDKDFDRIIRLDPTFNENRDRVGTYGKWLLKLFSKGNLNNEGHVRDLLTRFEGAKNRLKNDAKDIMRYKSLEEVDEMLNDDNNYTSLSHRQEVRQRQKDRHNVDLGEEAELVYEDNEWQVWIPKTYAASCKLGQGTSWCTASTETDSYFYDYTETDDLYININKKTGEKFQFHFESESYMDKDDEEINIIEWLIDNKSIYHKIYNKYINIDGVLGFVKNNPDRVFVYKGGSVPDNYASVVRKVIIPDSVTRIGDDAFYGCTSLTSVIIGNSVASIGYSAFRGCTSLKNVTIPDSVTKIGTYAFSNCTSLTSVTIPDSVTSIDTYAFYNCSSLTSVTIGNSVTSIGSSAFERCSNLTSITIPNSVMSMGDEAFADCDSLTSVTIGNGVTSIGDYAFINCSNLANIIVPESVKSIGKSAFKGLPHIIVPRGSYAEQYAKEKNIPVKYLNESFPMKFTLTEDIAAVQKNFPNIDDETFRHLIALDPTFNPNRDSVGTYGKWILTLYSKGEIKDEDWENVTQMLDVWETNKKRFTNKDIGQFKTLKQLEDALLDMPDLELSHRQKVRQNQKSRRKADLGNEADLVFDGTDWEVWVPKTYAASCKLGQHTSWCTASTEDEHYFHQYSSQGKLYIVINKHDDKKKYQFQVETNSYVNSDDEVICLIDFLFDEGEELFDFFVKLLLDDWGFTPGIGMDDTEEVSISKGQIEEVLSNVTVGWNTVTGDDCYSMIFDSQDWVEGFYFDTFYEEMLGVAIEALNEENKNRIKELTGLEEITTSSVTDYDNFLFEAFVEAIKGAYNESASYNVEAEAVMALEDAASAVEGIRADFHSDELVVKGTVSSFIELFREYQDYSDDMRYIFDDYLSMAIGSCIVANYDFQKPRGDEWGEIEDDLFNDYLENSLDEWFGGKEDQ